MDEGYGPQLATVLPVYSEEAHLGACLDALMRQTLPPSQHIIVVLDGGSTDGTRQIISEAQRIYDGPEFPRLLVVDNPDRTVAHARNLALQEIPPSVEYLIEMIGHAVVENDHLERRLEAWHRCDALAEGTLAGVGVKVVPLAENTGRVSSWIDGALASPLGQSGGQFARFDAPSPTDVPSFVMHARSALMSVDGWDTSFITSQDSDLSMRLKKKGYVLYRDPSPTVAMHKRTSLGKWWLMGHRYGFWRTKLLVRHPTRAKWQEFLPWLGVLSSLVLVLFASPLWWLPSLLYAGALTLGGLHQGLTQRSVSALFGVPLCLLMLHTSFSLGLVDGLVRKGRLPKDRA